MPPAFLLVDDDPVSSDGFIAYAERRGFGAFATADATRTAQLIHAVAPAVIALDCDMAGIDPVAIIERIGALSPDAELILFGRNEPLLAVCREAAASFGIGAVTTHVAPVDFRALARAREAAPALAIAS